jgi:Na+/H+ antiporter NhaD/arsenite permease-like protein
MTVPTLVKNNMPLFALGVLIILISFVSGDCKDQWKTPEDREVAYRNEKILNMCKGIGYGILAFLLLGGMIGERYFVGLGLILSLFALVNINAYLNLSKECQVSVHSNYNLMYALLGAGIGMMVYSGISQADTIFSLSKTKTFVHNKGKFLMMFANVIIILIGSLSVDSSNRCMDENAHNTRKIISIIFITLAVISSYVILLGKQTTKMYSRVSGQIKMRNKRRSMRNSSKKLE